MPKRGAKNVKTAPRLANKYLNIIQKVLVNIGKPFYLFFLYSILLVAAVINYLRNIKIPQFTIKLPSVSANLSFGIWHFVFIFLAAGGLAFWYLIIRDLPSVDTLVTRPVEMSTKIYDRNGVLLYKIYKNQNRTAVPLSKIPPWVIYATLAAEDSEFYSHQGISIKGIIRSIYKNARSGRLTGGSTITQQLVKNALLSPQKTLIRKLKEVVLALQTELKYSKNQILEMYLNEVAFGGTAYGIEEAARTYFGKDVDALSPAEGAYLAGLPQKPSSFSPWGSSPELGKARQEEILDLMAQNAFITKDEAERTKAEKLNFVPHATDIKAPHFVMFARAILEEKYGRETVEKGGLEVTTTLDYSIQQMAEATVATEVDKLVRYNATNAGALVIDPSNGEILAMVGSKNYFDIKSDGNVNVTLSPRPPGSSIKIVNYAYALSHGFTPASILSDTPVSFSVPGQPVYSPRDYDGTFRGNISLRSALAESRNIPAVKVLASYGVEKMISLGKDFGITTWEDKNRFGLSLTLGGGEVKLIELARVYATIANMGQRPIITPIVSIKDNSGNILATGPCPQKNNKSNLVLANEGECDTKQVVDPRVAYQLVDILKDNDARSPAFGSRSALVIPAHPEIAVKTGTSNELRDNLTLGFNQQYLVAVWVGNNNNSPMSKIASGVTGAAPIFNKIMTQLVIDQPSQDWPAPTGLVQLPCRGKNEWFLEENQPKKGECTPIAPQTSPSPSPIGRILPSAASTQVQF